MQLQVLAQERLPIKNGANVKFHTGTSETVATVYLLEGQQAAAGREHLVQFRLSNPLLDYFDRVGVTRRAPDNTRYLGPKADGGL